MPPISLDHEASEEVYEDYTSAPGYYIKKVWICIQAAIMT